MPARRHPRVIAPATRSPLSALEARIPPPVLWALASVAMYALHALAPGARLWPNGRPVYAWLVAGALVIAGLALLGDSFRRFLRAKTWFHPIHPERATTLVLEGPYRWTRNPMYLGLLLVLAGGAAWLGSLTPTLVLPAFVAVVTRLQIVPEERALLERFGGEYASYRDEVRRWIGRR